MKAYRCRYKDIAQTKKDRADSPKKKEEQARARTMASVDSAANEAAFEKELRSRKYVKLLHENLTHYGFTYKMGLNVDVIPFDPDVECKPGGLYFCKPTDIRYHHSGIFDAYTLIADVEIPADAQFAYGRTKCKADRVVLSNMRCLECALHGDNTHYDTKGPHTWSMQFSVRRVMRSYVCAAWSAFLAMFK
jgi:hypothetical protein